MLYRSLIAVAVSVLSIHAAAQEPYPTRPVTLVIPYSVGGSTDVVARIVGAKLSEMLDQQFIVEPRTGAGGNLATQYVTSAKPDGHTILMGTGGPIAINPGLYSKLPFDIAKDLKPVTLIASTAFALLAAPSFPPNSVKELVELAKANPGKFNFASLGNGSEAHLLGERFNATVGMKLVHVPFKGFGPAATELMTGNVQILFGSMTSSVKLTDAKRVKALAVTSEKRHRSMPDVPTMAEAGFPGFETYVWFGMLAPAQTPDAIVERLHGAVLKALQSKDVVDLYTAQSLDVVGAGPKEFAARIAADTKMWAGVIKQSGAKVD